MATYKEYLRAQQMGTAAHQGQIWNGGRPYVEHLKAVDEILLRHLAISQLDEETRTNLYAAAWLHDAVEDTGMSLDLIEKETNPQVRALVWAVTEENGPDGKKPNRKKRHENTFPKIRNTPYATALKLADRIANVQASAQDRGGYYQMYKKEHEEFKAALYVRGMYESMWTELDNLFLPEGSKKAIKIADQIMSALGYSPDVHAEFRRKLIAIIQENIE